MAKDNKHTTYLLDEFSKIPEINNPVTDLFIRNLVEYCAMFETKNEHSAALNTYLLGTVPIFFYGYRQICFLFYYWWSIRKKD